MTESQYSIPVEIEQIFTLRHNLVKMYMNNPSEITWRVLISSAIKDSTPIIQYLSDLSRLAAFDLDTPVEDLQANLIQVRKALDYLIGEITQTNIYPNVSQAFDTGKEKEAG